jgi:MFS transporter, MCT family, solute carrier family 16 (monocarboxylic acid transporters), member 10
MGIAFSIVGMSLLLGTPIEGALLRMRAADDGFLWFKSIIFCGVGLSLLFFKIGLD